MTGQFIAFLYLAIVAVAEWMTHRTWVLAGLYLLISLATLISYGIDKRAAIKGRRRIPESTLHLLALAGGWPGALFAQHLFRHKTVKPAFRVVFWSTVVLNAACTAGVLITAQGREALSRILPLL
jgi:uncharacterized membrane protein YsdA (DUF1294 family)